MSDTIHKKSTIIIDVELNENNVPVTMKWSAEDGNANQEDTRAMLLALWDPFMKHGPM